MLREGRSRLRLGLRSSPQVYRRSGRQAHYVRHAERHARRPPGATYREPLPRAQTLQASYGIDGVGADLATRAKDFDLV